MSTPQSTRLFADGPASTPCRTRPARLVADSQFPCGVDGPATVASDGDRPVAARAAEVGD